jgi:hypothetical protein
VAAVICVCSERVLRFWAATTAARNSITIHDRSLIIIIVIIIGIIIVNCCYQFSHRFAINFAIIVPSFWPAFGCFLLQRSIASQTTVVTAGSPSQL